MPAIKVADLFARLGIKSDTKGLDKFDKKMNKAKDSLLSMKNLMAGFVGGAIVSFIKRTAESGDRLNKQAKFLGFASEELKAYHTVAGDAGIKINNFDVAMQRANRRIADAVAGSKPLTKAFADLGVKLTDNEGNLRTANDILPDIADGLAKVDNEAQRTALAFKIFDSEGAQLVKILGDGSEALLKQVTAARELQFVTGQQRQISERFVSALGLVSTAFGEVGERITIGIIEPFTEALELFLVWIRLNNKFIRSGLDKFADRISVAFSFLLKVLRSAFSLVDNLFKLFGVLPDNMQLAIIAVLSLALAFTTAGKAILIFLRRFLLIPAIIASIFLVAEDLAVALLGGDSAIRKMTESADPLVNAIGSIALAFGEVLGVVGKMIGFLLAGAPGGFEEFFSIVSGGMSRIKELFRGEIEIIKAFFSDLFDSLPVEAQAALVAFAHVIETVGQSINSFLGSIVAAVDVLIKLLMGDFDGAFKALEASAGLFKDAFVSIFGDAFSSVMSLFTRFKDFILGSFTGLGDKVSDSIRDSFGSAVDSAINSLPDFVKKQLGVDIVPSVEDPELPEVDISSELPTEAEILEQEGKDLSSVLPPGFSAVQNGPSISNSNKVSSRNVTNHVSVGGITNRIVVPKGTTQEQQVSISNQVADKMAEFMDNMLIDAQADVPELS